MTSFEQNQFIKVSFRDSGIVVLALTRPEALNALNLAVLRELKSTLIDLGQNPTVRVIVIRGDGDRAFVAGADIKEMSDMDRSQAAAFSKVGNDVFLTLESLPKVTIAAVHGFALGGGFELAMACDFVMASEKAQFGLPEVSLGVIPGFGGTVRLARVIGTARAKELIYSGRRINADEAKLIGLVSQVIPQDRFFDEVIALAKKIAGHSLTAILAAKRLLNEFEESIGVHPKIDAETYQFGSLFGDSDQKEGMNAFVEKRTPRFKGLE